MSNDDAEAKRQKLEEKRAAKAYRLEQKRIREARKKAAKEELERIRRRNGL
jgi:hypothetical protein